MKKKYIVLLILIALAAASAVTVWKYTFRKAESSVVSKKADVEIAASDLLNAFETDENQANTLYLDKIVLVTGKIETVSEDSIGLSVYLKESDSVSGILCSFEKGSVEPSSLQSGNIVRIKGICTGYLMDVVMNKCSLEGD
jgi:hypothetical protein